MMTDASRHLVALAERIAAAYAPYSRAILLTGSAATGESDYYSDLDLIAYHPDLPSDADLARARAEVGVEEVLFVGGDRDAGRYQETYLFRGIECQLGHVTIAAWERDMAKVLEELDAASPIQKAIDGLLHGLPLHGHDLIDRFQERARAYPDGLARAMVTTHLRFVPIWRLEHRLRARDARLWYHEVLVESGQHLLAVLAGLNRVYFSAFQFKRMHQFVARLCIAPDNLADRLEGLFTAEPPLAIAELERLVAQTIDLVQLHVPDIDVAAIRRQLGARDRPWRPAPG